ncbi:recombinase family protein [Mesorhizobium sp. GR13]|uniref:recombinase family protein n=1 Tax=Mesorhizobium sp. GR13 TaxID=2562308 RepID=UPI0010BF67C2|nr:recombinase family protein [Mesorhizobium sp. GR13]
MKFVGYYRVSTRKQSRSGLGLEVQQQKVRDYAASNGELLGEFVETESGRKDDRIELSKAMNLARKSNASLLIAKLDRFSRRVSFIASMMEKGIPLTVVEMPNATDFQLHIFAALAQEERRLISERTKAALAQAKARGTKLGKNGKIIAEVNRSHAQQLAKTIRLPDGWVEMSYSSIARELNEAKVTTPNGNRFFPQTVKNLLKYVER